MKKIVAINCSPRTTWNTAALVREAVKGDKEQGAEITIIDLYKSSPAACPVLATSCHRAWVDASAGMGLLLFWRRCGVLTV